MISNSRNLAILLTAGALLIGGLIYGGQDYLAKLVPATVQVCDDGTARVVGDTQTSLWPIRRTATDCGAMTISKRGQR